MEEVEVGVCFLWQLMGWYGKWFVHHPFLCNVWSLNLYYIVAECSSILSSILVLLSDARPDSVLFSFGIVEKCTRQEKILQFLMSESNKLERDGLDLSLLSELMGLQTVMFDAQQLSHSPLIYPSGQLDAPKSLVDFVADMVCSSKLTVLPDGRVLLTGSGTEMKDVLSTVAEFYLSKNSTMWKKQSMLIPKLTRYWYLDLVVFNSEARGSFSSYAIEKFSRFN